MWAKDHCVRGEKKQEMKQRLKYFFFLVDKKVVRRVLSENNNNKNKDNIFFALFLYSFCTFQFLSSSIKLKKLLLSSYFLFSTLSNIKKNKNLPLCFLLTLRIFSFLDDKKRNVRILSGEKDFE